MTSNKLSDRVLSNIDLDKWCRRNVPGFVGVINRSEFENYYKKMKSGDSLIINLDPEYSRGGTHWTALRVSSEAPIVYYKDSFGAPCPDEIIDTINRHRINNIPRGLIYGNRIYQKLSEVNCGKRAAYFLRDMAQCSAHKKEIECFELGEQ